MKIGIISEFDLHTVNFGNHLQAYALNYYLRKAFDAEVVDSIALCGKQMGQHTNVFSLAFLQKMTNKLLSKVQKGKTEVAEQFDKTIFHSRLVQFEAFRRSDPRWSVKEMNSTDLQQSAYDALIVGSDVVWSQYPLWISRTKFLDFEAQKPFRRISYAASFGRDYIPKENVKYLKKYLHRFDAISVREHSSVSMLESVGIDHAAYCLDPTLLLSSQEWEKIEKRPEAISDRDDFIFVYLLGADCEQRRQITVFAREKNLKIVVIPHANGYRISADEGFGDIQLMACSVENWIWLIHHAQYVFTDSFHGTVFSTIFETKFMVLKRNSENDINNRMQDYLREIGQLDKTVAGADFGAVDHMAWDYRQITDEIEKRRMQSILFLRKALSG